MNETETSTLVSTALEEPKHSTLEGTPLVSGISDKTTKTCHPPDDTGLIQLAARFLLQYQQTSSPGNLAFSSKIQPCNVFHLDIYQRETPNYPAAKQLSKRLYFFHTPTK